MTTATVNLTTSMTAEEFGLKYSGQHVEFVDGEVKELPMAGGRHGIICNLFAFYLTQHILANDLGRVFSNDTFVKVPTEDDPERVYGPDICFVSYVRLAKDAAVPAGVIPVCPELVVEVRSPSDTWAQVMRKATDYLNAGVPVVVALDPPSGTTYVYRNATPHQTFASTDMLVIPDVLPGFSVSVARFFE